MVVVKIPEELPALTARGKIGKPEGLGFFMFGWSELGTLNEYTGYYKRNGRWKKQTTVRTRHYWPANPQTTAQQANRTTFANGVTAWHELSENEKQTWRDKKHPKSRNGFMRFMSAYLKGEI